MSEQVLAALARYGEPALFLITAIAAVGVPLPVMLLLIVAGSMAAQGVMDVWMAIGISSAGAVAGDQLGYLIGRWGGEAMQARLTRLLGSEDRLRELDARARSWGGAGVFFSRWLVTPLGPFVNLASGAAGYSWMRFTFWDITGEFLCSALFVGLGFAFSDRVQAIGALIGDLTWTLVAILAAIVLGWQLFFRKRAGAGGAQA
jgi:membrane-associated protein